MKIVNKIIRAIYFFGLIIFFNNIANAVEVRGSATESYEGIYSKDKATKAMEAAKSKACVNAFNKYVQGLEESKRMIFESLKDQIYSNVFQYMTCSTVVEENLDKKEKKAIVVMRADIDETKLNLEINKSSKVFDSDSSEKSRLAMIFFSRTVASQRQFDARISNVEKNTKGLDINEEETKSGVSSMTTETKVTETGGSKLKKADVTEYLVDDNDTVKLEAGMKEVFTKARFEPISGGRQVRGSWGKMKNQIISSLESGGGIPEETKWEIEDILMDKGISYVVFAYFDVGVPEVDNATGNQVVNAALTIAEITRLGNDDPVSMGTISGVQMRGQGSSTDIAKNNAINLVAKSTAEKLVALINSKGIN